jgi:hypothetical protein
VCSTEPTPGRDSDKFVNQSWDLEEKMKKASLISGIAVLAVFFLASCSLFTDVIVGTWQQVSVNGVATVLVTEVQFTDSTYTGTTAGVTSNAGTWTKSGSTYTLTGSFFGFISTSSAITPVFSSSNNTLTFTDSSGFVEVYNRQ